MAEILGLIASIITVVGTFRTISHAFLPFFRAETELRRIQDDIESFSKLVAELQLQHVNLSSPELKRVLTSAEHSLQKLNNLFQDKILRRNDGLETASRNAWIKHKPKVMKLHAKLTVEKAALQGVICANTLAVSCRVEDMLIDIDRKVEMIHHQLLPESRLSTKNDHLQKVASGTSTGLQHLDETAFALNMPFRHGVVTISGNKDTNITENCRSPGLGFSSRTTFLGQPAGPLEKSPGFFPESYTLGTRTPKLIAFASYQQDHSSGMLTNRFQMLYFPSPRSCVQVDLSVAIPSDSIYQTYARYSTHRKTRILPKRAHAVPISLLEALQRGLDGVERVEDRALVAFQLIGNGVGHTSARMSPFAACNVASDQLVGAWKESRQDIYASLYHLGCRMLDEKQVSIICPLEFPNRFVACLDQASPLVEEVKSIQRPPTIEFVYNIRALHLLRNHTGVIRLAGVTSNATRQVKSYLVKYPDTRCESLLQRASNLLPGTPWRTIEDWSRQLVQIVAAVHSSGLVVGTLWCQRPPLLIDTFGHLHLCRFENTIYIAPVASPFYPPEYHHHTKLFETAPIQTSDEDSGLITPAFDIFQLGSLLWILAQSWATLRSPVTVRKEVFYPTPEVDMQGLYTGPSTLPRLPDAVPGYFQHIIDFCYTHDPVHRPRAADLQYMFPDNSTSADVNVGHNVTHQLMDEEGIRACRFKTACCSHCWEQMSGLMYTCSICQGGDVDLCPPCFKKGLHCFSESHLLIESTHGGFLDALTRQYTSVDDIGKRKLYET